MEDNKNILNIYFATSKTCNIYCKYCYLPVDFNQSRKTTDTRIINSLEEFIEKIENENYKIGKFCLHGAEPSLMSSKTLGKIIILVNEHWKKNNITDLYVSIQSNGIRLTKSYLEEVLELIDDPKKLRIGFSIDPPKIVHDLMRDSSYDIVMKNYRTAQKLGFPTAVLCVISSETMNYLEEFAYWIKEQLAKKHKLGNPYKIKAKLATGYYSLKEEQLRTFSNFIIKKNIYSILQIISPGYCIQNGNNCEWYEFDIDGNCYSCNKNFNINGIFANWKKETFNIITAKRKKLFLNEYTNPECSKCCYEMVCNSGCPIDRHKEGSMKGKAHECYIINQVFKHLEQQGISLIEYFYNNH